ncbi:alpha/beta hydrolase [Nocardioides bruguierae]|uniref:Alpha/beta hydrolase n=1 Tax=Nocardioides bruguierae TaxID=2945102 RepID=A0A9X2DBG6_9ACTN|nr:alpha/beta hydrolase [Nocardioides bruguierae]MCM0622773.1 alpha/beta hydrolase [Nocardioides bruguierae]
MPTLHPAHPVLRGSAPALSLDAELAEAALALVPSDLRDVAGARAANAARHAAAAPVRDRDGVRSADTTLPGPAGPVPVRVLHPVPAGDQESDEDSWRAGSRAGVRGAVLYLHGGAFALGDLDACDTQCAEYAREADVVVVAVDYRLAPEHPAPAGLEDGVAALRWLHAHAEELGVDPARVAVAGASAGGALAAGTTLRARDEGGLPVAHLLLVQPVLDDRRTTASARGLRGVPVFDADANAVMWETYLAGAEADGYVAPARADLRGLPPTTVHLAEHDPLHDEGRDFAAALAAEGVRVATRTYPGTFHGFDSVVPGAGVSRRARADQAAVLRDEVGQPDRAAAHTPEGEADL